MTKTDNLTPAELTALLQVSDRTVRRLAEAYEGVYSRLPTSKRKTRLFPPVAVERITDAYATLRAAPGMSATEVFTHQRDGLPVRTRERVTPDVLAPVMDELRRLRSEIAFLHELLINGQGAVSHDNPPPVLTLDAGPDQSTPAPDGPAGDADRPDMPTTPLSRHHARLVQRLEAGATLEQRGLTTLLVDDGNTSSVDGRTVKALVKRGLIEATPDGYRLTTDRML